MANSVPNLRIHHISFIGSYPNVEKAPLYNKPEFAFIGRSNVGKSSLINYLSNRKNIAKTSSTPGKTQMINLYNVDDTWLIADLPGYGYARVSKKTRAKWSRMITDYLQNRSNLQTVFLLVDSKVEPLQADIEMMVWMAKQGIPFSIIFTKTDKLKPKDLKEKLAIYVTRLKLEFEDLPNIFMTSSSAKSGAEDLLDYIYHIMQSTD